jgi:ligand-binding sensor domain-containing protein
LAQEATGQLQHLTLKDGLPNPSVLDIRQDEQGFMWFATADGVSGGE